MEQHLPLALLYLTEITSPFSAMERDFWATKQQHDQSNPDDRNELNSVAMEAINLLRYDVNEILERLSALSLPSVDSAQINPQQAPAEHANQDNTTNANTNNNNNYGHLHRAPRA